MSFREISEKLSFISFILFIPAVPFLFLWGFFAPVGFWQNIAMLVFSIILYPILTFLWWIFMGWMAS